MERMEIFEKEWREWRKEWREWRFLLKKNGKNGHYSNRIERTDFFQKNGENGEKNGENGDF